MRKIIVVFVLFLFCGSVAGQSSDNMSPKEAYKALLQQEQGVKNEIQTLTATLSSLRGSKAKKMAKRLDQLVAQQEAIQRKMMFFPESVRNDQVSSKIDEASRNQVRQMIDDKVLAKGGSLDDAEDESPVVGQTFDEYWSVAISISTSPDPSKYRAYGDVEVESMGGRYIFFVGRYSTKTEADTKCKQIVKKGKYRDAFVVNRKK